MVSLYYNLFSISYKSTRSGSLNHPGFPPGVLPVNSGFQNFWDKKCRSHGDEAANQFSWFYLFPVYIIFF